MSEPKRKAIIATLQSILFTTWEPHQGWTFLLPSHLPNKTGVIHLPDSFTKKNNAGICFKAKAPFGQDDDYLGLECLFPEHAQYNVTDTETKYDLYIVPSDKIIMTRIPPDDILTLSMEHPISRGERKDSGFSIASIEHSKKD